jgi:adenylosuccinate lyase
MQEKFFTELSKFKTTEKVELASAKDISKYESKLKTLSKEIDKIDNFKKEAASEMLTIVKWLNDLKAGVLKVGLSYKDVKGLNELNDLYWKVNKKARENKIIK